MYATLDPAQREQYPIERFTELHAAFAEMAGVAELSGTTGEPHTSALPPEPRPADYPAPTPTPAPSADPSADASSSVEPSAEPTAPPDPDAVLAGPVPAIAVPVELDVASDRFGAMSLDRELTMVNRRDGWLVRWSPAVVFPELGEEGTLRLDRTLGTRGRIVGTDGTVWAETREDGARVYPQEALGGQVIGYVSDVTADDLATLADAGYEPGDVVGRSGLEFGAEDLLRGTPGWTLVAVTPDAPEAVIDETEMVPGADIAITLRPEIQAVAQDALTPYAGAATAVVDPKQRRRVGARQPAGLQPERDDHRRHPRRSGAHPGQRRPDPQQGGPRRLPGRVVVQAVHPGRGAQDRRRDAAEPGHLPADLAVRRLHVPQLHEPLPARAGHAGAGDGVQLQHHVHAARVLASTSRTRPR